MSLQNSVAKTTGGIHLKMRQNGVMLVFLLRIIFNITRFQKEGEKVLKRDLTLSPAEVTSSNLQRN